MATIYSGSTDGEIGIQRGILLSLGVCGVPVKATGMQRSLHLVGESPNLRFLLQRQVYSFLYIVAVLVYWAFDCLDMTGTVAVHRQALGEEVGTVNSS